MEKWNCEVWRSGIGRYGPPYGEVELLGMEEWNWEVWSPVCGSEIVRYEGVELIGIV